MSTVGTAPVTPALRVALYSGVALERDAVSRSFIHKIEILERLREQGYPVEIVAFTHQSEYRHPSIRIVPDLMAVLRHPEFDAADVHIFEYAMSYDLFNAIFLTDRPVLVIDHNTTPPGFVEDPDTRAVCIRTLDERVNLDLATRVATDGEFTRDELLELGISPERLSVLHLPPANSFVGRSEHTFDIRARDGLVRLLYVGRLVRAKGIHDLLDAARVLWEKGATGFTLTVAGSLRYADAETIQAISETVTRFGGTGRFVHVANATDEAIANLYGECDALVMPSYHEGYCVPVVEAMTSGCYVIGSEAGNLPTVMGELGSTFAAGDVDGLVDAIERFIAALNTPDALNLALPTSSGPMTLRNWHRAVAAHLRTYSLEHYEREFLRLLGETVTEGRDLPTGWWQTFDTTTDAAVMRSL
jgi:glycosyltransferase involved in cell wall biosynthesis